MGISQFSGNAQVAGGGGGGSVTWNPNLNATMSITTAQTSDLGGVAVVFLDANAVSGFSTSTAPGGTPYDPDFHEITWCWRVVEDNLTWQTSLLLNMPVAWKDANLRYGKNVAFVLEEGETYNIECFGVDRFGNAATDTVQVTTTTADSKFPSTATIVYSEVSDFADAPSGATQVSTFSAMNSALQARGNQDTRLLFRADEDYRSAITGRIEAGAFTSAVLYLGKYQTGADPILPLLKYDLNATHFNALFVLPQTTTGELKCVHIDFRGDWDASEELGEIGGPLIWRDTTMSVLCHRCKMSGHRAFNSQNRLGDCYFVWSDGWMTDWQDYSIFGFASKGGIKRFAVIGSGTVQNPDARGGTISEKNFGNTHCFRWEGFEDSVVLTGSDHCYGYFHGWDSRSRGGWSSGAGGTSDNPAFRCNSNGKEQVTCVGDRMVLESGYRVLKITGRDEGPTVPDRPSNKLFDKLILIGTTESQWLVDCNQGCGTVRNVLGVVANVPMNSNGYLEGLISFNPDDTVEPSNDDSPVAVHSATLVNLLTSANNRFANVGAQANIPGIQENGFITADFANNITYMPNQDAPETATAVDTSTALGVTPRYKGLAPSAPILVKAGNGSASMTLTYAELLDHTGAATSQAYWQARTGNRHGAMRDAGIEYVNAHKGEFTVQFNAGDVTVTRTSGVWNSGATWRFKLDQSDNLPTPDAATDISAIAISTYKPTSAANSAGGATAVDDILMNARAGSNLDQANTGTPTIGALEFV